MHVFLVFFLIQCIYRSEEEYKFISFSQDKVRSFFVLRIEKFICILKFCSIVSLEIHNLYQAVQG